MRQGNTLSRRCPSPGNSRGGIAPFDILGSKIQNLPPVIEPYTEILVNSTHTQIQVFRCEETTGVVKEPQASAAVGVVWTQQKSVVFS
jgi:hypothetical protein